MGVKEAKRRGTKEQERTGEQLGLIAEKASALKSQSDDPNAGAFFIVSIIRVSCADLRPKGQHADMWSKPSYFY